MNGILHKQLRSKGCLFMTVLLFLTVLTAGCGKSEIKRNTNADRGENIEEFCTQFFTESNLPYIKLSTTDVQNTPSEYLFYIKGGMVYRTLNDYEVVITDRENIRESEENKGINYSGELYRIFEDDEFDLLRITAAGDYAILAAPSSIPDWENNQVITSFIQFASEYHQSK